MKKIGLLLLWLFLIFISCAENEVESTEDFNNFTVNDHQNLLSNLQLELSDVLLNSKPENITLEQYTRGLVNGDFKISSETELEILEIMKPLEEYGSYVGNRIGEGDLELNDKYTLAMFNPKNNFSSSFLSENFEATDINPFYHHESFKGGDDFLKCAAVAVGAADALWALGGSNVSSWSRAAMKKAFKAVAKRFLGPIGVAIAVVSFGVCMAQ